MTPLRSRARRDGDRPARTPARGDRALTHTQGESWDDLKEMARDAVLCHFDEGGAPRVIRLHLVRDEAIAV